MSIHNYKCPKCGSTTIALERRMNGDAICSDFRERRGLKMNRRYSLWNLRVIE